MIGGFPSILVSVMAKMWGLKVFVIWVRLLVLLQIPFALAYISLSLILVFLFLFGWRFVRLVCANFTCLLWLVFVGLWSGIFRIPFCVLFVVWDGGRDRRCSFIHAILASCFFLLVSSLLFLVICW